MRFLIRITLLSLIFSIGNTAKAECMRKSGGSNSEVAVGMYLVPDKLDPLGVWNHHHYLIIQSVYETLVRTNSEGRLVGDLATSWQIGQDGMSYVFKLRKDAVFHNGQKVRAIDVANSIAAHFWRGSKSVVRGYLENIILGILDSRSLKVGDLPSGITVKNDDEIEIRLRKPYPPLLYVLAIPGFSIFPSGVDLSLNPIGSGPYQATKRGADWLLSKSKSYAGKRSPLNSGMVVCKVNSGPAQISHDLNWNADIYLGLPIGIVEKTKLPEDYEEVKLNNLVINHLFLNANNTQLFGSERLRLDFRKLIQTIVNDNTSSAYFKFEPYYLPRGTMPYSYYQRPIVKFDSQQLTKNWGNYLSGKTIHLVIQNGHMPEGVARKIAASLGEAGLNVRLEYVNPDVARSRMSRKDYDIISGGYVGGFPDPDAFLDPLRPGSNLSYGVMPTKGLFAKLDAVRFIRNPAVRLEGYSDVLKDFENQGYVIPIYRKFLPIIMKRNLTMPDTSYRSETVLWGVIWK